MIGFDRNHRSISPDYADGDIDGAHIRVLLLTLFYAHFPKLIESGHIYVASGDTKRVMKKRHFFAEIKEGFQALADERTARINGVWF